MGSVKFLLTICQFLLQPGFQIPELCRNVFVTQSFIYSFFYYQVLAVALYPCHLFAGWCRVAATLHLIDCRVQQKCQTAP